MTDDVFKYWAFLSYSQQDNAAQRPDDQGASHLCWGDWLHDALKTFAVPAEFVGQINGRGEITPDRIHPIFQDTQEQPGDANLSAETRQALEQSRCLVVICSPRSATSLHVNEAVRYFKQLGRARHIFPIVISGEPNAGEDNRPGISPEAQCFVPALRHPLQPDGTLDTTRRPGKHIVVDARHGATRREILTNDHRNAEADLEMAKVQLIAVLLGVAFNGLWWREQKRHFVDLAEAQHQARQALNQVEEARRQLQEAQRQTREAENRILEAQNLPRDVHGQILEAQTKAQEAENRAREAQQQLQEFQNKARDTQNQLEEARDRILAAENKFREAQNQVLETRQQAEETRRQLEEAKNQAQAVPAQIQPVAIEPAEIQEAQRQAAEIRQQLEAAQNEISEARRQAEDARRQLEETKNQTQGTPAEILDAQRQVAETRRQLEESQSQTQQAEARLQAARSQAEAAQNQAREAKQQAEDARRQVQEVQAQQSQNQTDEAKDKIQAAQIQVQKARRVNTVLVLITLIALLATGAMWWQRKLAGQPLAKPEESDLAQGKLDQERIRQALQKFGAVQTDADRFHNLDELAARIPTNEIPEALKTASTILGEQQRNHFQHAVMDHWLKTDQVGALNWVRQLADTDSRNNTLGEIIPELVADNPTNALTLLDSLNPTQDEGGYILSNIIGAWMDRQPDAAVDWVKARPDSPSKNDALGVCFWLLAKKDAPKALTLAGTFPEGTWRDMLIAHLFSEWSARDLAAATTAFQQLPEGMAKTKAGESVLLAQITQDPAAAMGNVTNLPVGDFRQNAFTELSRHWAGTNAPAALAWAQSLPPTAEQTNVVNQAIAAWANKDPQAAMQYAIEHPELPGEAVGSIAAALPITDLPAATNWVISLPDGEKKDKALFGLIEIWSETDPKGLATYVLTLPAGYIQSQCLTAACRELVVHDFPGTVEMLKPIADDDLRRQFLEQAGRGGDFPHMEQTAKYIATMLTGDDQQAAIKGLLASWPQSDPESAANWLASFPETNSQPEHLQSVIKDWAQTEPTAAARWLATMPAGTNSEATTSAFLEGSVVKYPEFAAQWTQSVTNDAQRQKYQVQVAREWMKTDPTAAAKWINQQNLPDELKQLK